MSGKKPKKTIWDVLHAKLVDSSPISYYDEIDFIVGLIVSGGKDNDISYLGSDDFTYHCKLARLDPNLVARTIDQMWYYINNKIPFPQLEEDLDDDIDDYY